MSSYISGSYSLTTTIAEAIRAQALRELRLVQQEIGSIQAQLRANEQAQNAMLLERSNREKNRLIVEAGMAETVTERQQKAEARRQAMREEVQALLIAAEDQLTLLDNTLPEKHALADKVKCMKDSIQLFGATEQSLETVKVLARVTVPNAIMQVNQAKEQQRLERIAHEDLRVSGAVVDQSLRFVSLNVQAAEKKEIERPWDLFVGRVRALAAHQTTYGLSGAKAMMAEMESLAPDKQNLFMLKHRDQVRCWEEEIAAFISTTEENEEKQHELYDAYAALFNACAGINSAPMLPSDTKYDQLRLEHDRLMGVYLKQRNQQYFENAFRKVFEEHGLIFETVSIDDKQNMQIEFSMDQDAGVRIMRSPAGAFDMVFYGNSAGQQVSQDQRRKVTEKAHDFCSMMPSISQELQKRGINFQQQWVQEPTEEAIVFETRTIARNRSEQARKIMYME